MWPARPLAAYLSSTLSPSHGRHQPTDNFIMEPTTTCSFPSHLSPSALDTMASSPPTTFLKMEDLHNTPPPPSTAPSLSLDTASVTDAPPPVVVHSKQAKKRKSWGQELPEPKTALPPRKRAKTDDEKEQRRIERIKRNRAAAHNSRERKRQETETLAVALARANAELDAYRKHFGALPPNVVLPEVTLSIDRYAPPLDSTLVNRQLTTTAVPIHQLHLLLSRPEAPSTLEQHPKRLTMTTTSSTVPLSKKSLRNPAFPTSHHQPSTIWTPSLLSRNSTRHNILQ